MGTSSFIQTPYFHHHCNAPAHEMKTITPKIFNLFFLNTEHHELLILFNISRIKSNTLTTQKKLYSLFPSPNQNYIYCPTHFINSTMSNKMFIAKNRLLNNLCKNLCKNPYHLTCTTIIHMDKTSLILLSKKAHIP